MTCIFFVSVRFRSIGLYTPNLKALMASLSKASPLATPLQMMHGQLKAQKNVNATYNAIIPILHDALSRGD